MSGVKKRKGGTEKAVEREEVSLGVQRHKERQFGKQGGHFFNRRVFLVLQSKMITRSAAVFSHLTL